MKRHARILASRSMARAATTLVLCALAAGPPRGLSGQEPALSAGNIRSPTAAPGDRFQDGNRLYQAGDYAGALDAYLGIYRDGLESGELHYNIANAYFKLGDLGRAILFYERAHIELPRDETVRANLDLARSLTADQITPLPGFWLPRVVSWWVNLVPRGWLIAIVVVGYLALAVALLYRVLSTRPTPWATRIAVAAGISTLVFGVNLTVRELGIGRPDRAVVLQPEASVQSAPSDEPSLQLFTIHEGAVVRIDRTSGEWFEVVLEDGKVGWIRAGGVERI